MKNKLIHGAAVRKYTYHVAKNPQGWIFVEYEPGKRLTKNMVNLDFDREDVKENEYGIVLFYNERTARMLLKDEKNNS